MQRLEKSYKRIVIKIGSSIIFPEGLGRNFKGLSGILAEISGLIRQGKEVIVVSSGAIAQGMSLLKFVSRPKELSYLQAVAAIGQHELMDIYRKFLARNKLKCAQILLTWEDFDDRSRYLNAKNTLLALLKYGAVPIINENDTVSTDEIKFGDNDRLSALVASLVNADLLLILSDVDGLLDKNKELVLVVDEITPQVKALACPTDKKVCVGGMITKLEAAKIAVDSGIPCVIANGKRRNIISCAIKTPSQAGTLFVSKKSLAAKERWIAFGTKPKGKILVDSGAKAALLNNKSLLSVGILGIQGDFDSRDIVGILDTQNFEFARGRVSVSSKQLDKVKGLRYDKEIIHRDNIVIL